MEGEGDAGEGEEEKIAECVSGDDDGDDDDDDDGDDVVALLFSCQYSSLFTLYPRHKMIRCNHIV